MSPGLWRSAPARASYDRSKFHILGALSLAPFPGVAASERGHQGLPTYLPSFESQSTRSGVTFFIFHFIFVRGSSFPGKIILNLI